MVRTFLQQSVKQTSKNRLYTSTISTTITTTIIIINNIYFIIVIVSFNEIFAHLVDTAHIFIIDTTTIIFLMLMITQRIALRQYC